MEDVVTKYLFNPTIGKIVAVTVGLLVLWTVLKVLRRGFVNKISNNQTRYRTNKLVNSFGFLVAIIFITVIFNEKLGGLTVAFGVAGAGIAFALQEVIASVAGWIAIVFGGFYKTGDRVQLGGIKGDVIDIGVLRTSIMEIGNWVDGDLYNGRTVLVANSFVFKEPVFNYSGEFPFLWDEIKVPIQFGSNYAKTEEILTKAANGIVGSYAQSAEEFWEQISKHNLVEKASTAPMVTLVLNDNWVEFTLRYTVKFDKRRSTKDLLFKQVLREVEATNGEVKFASATFHLVEAPTFRVSIDK